MTKKLLVLSLAIIFGGLNAQASQDAPRVEQNQQQVNADMIRKFQRLFNDVLKPFVHSDQRFFKVKVDAIVDKLRNEYGDLNMIVNNDGLNLLEYVILNADNNPEWTANWYSKIIDIASYLENVCGLQVIHSDYRGYLHGTIVKTVNGASVRREVETHYWCRDAADQQAFYERLDERLQDFRGENNINPPESMMQPSESEEEDDEEDVTIDDVSSDDEEVTISDVPIDSDAEYDEQNEDAREYGISAEEAQEER